MKLVTKLLILSFFTILIPMLIIVFFSAFMIYQSSAISQWEYLESIRDNLENEIIETEKIYITTIKEAADTKLLRDKFYVYEKYWNQLTESLIAYDLEPVADFLKNISHDSNIEVIALYRRDKTSFYPVAVHGNSQYLPSVLYKDLVQTLYNKITYRRYPDGIYLDIVYPIFSDGRLVGLVQFIHSYNEDFLLEYAKTFGIEYALISRNAVMFNSQEAAIEAVKNTVSDAENNPRKSFRVGSTTYSGVVIPFELGEEAVGDLVLYIERASLFGGESYLMQRLMAITLLCIMIPVVTFFIKEIRLIRAINSLLTATDAISSGNYNSRVDVRSRDEIGLLNRNFNDMVEVLKRNRDELQRQNEELAVKNTYIDAVFQSLRINIIVLDPERKIKVVSKNVSSRLELTEEQYGKDLLETEPFLQEKQLLKKTIENVLESKSFIRLYSVKFGITSYEMDFYPVIETDRSLSAVVLVLNNVTEHMDMERALIHSDRLASVGQMAAGLAHEINNPMSIILNHVQLLQTDALSEEEEQRFIGRIESEIKRVSRLINNLLKFSRDEKIQPELIDLGEIFSEVIWFFDPKASNKIVQEFYDGTEIKKQHADFFRLKFKKRKISFYILHTLSRSELFCSRDSLKQVLFNIIKNAIETCGDEDVILVADLEKVSGGTKIILKDNGCGMDEDELSNVFELFYTKGKPGGGVGLGLPLCKRLMNNMGGEIGISSEKEKGTTVTLLFPDREAFYG